MLDPSAIPLALWVAFGIQLSKLQRRNDWDSFEEEKKALEKEDSIDTE
ncbi:MAG: hypothetical protein ACXAB5_05800 [Candidatus Thorarchaeota archaeon]|jgi:hypothetical protein